ncbi:MAG: Hint domain-containing protein [Pseudoruegeria sp.]
MRSSVFLLGGVENTTLEVLHVAAQLNELSYNYGGAGGDFVEIRVDTGEDVSALFLETYVKSGKNVRIDLTIAVSTGTYTTDGTYDYYVIETSLGGHPRSGVVLSDTSSDPAQAVDNVFWGNSIPGNIIGGTGADLSDDDVLFVDDPLKSDTENTIVPDDSGTWVINGPTVGGSNFPCFVRGTHILTPKGNVPVEHLIVGDLIATQDHGEQPIRWIGSKVVEGTEPMSPILIKAGALNNDNDLLVSPQHRFLLQGWKCELLFGEEEVLVTAKALLCEGLIETQEVDKVEYFHLLFDSHQIIFAEGAPTESLHPGDHIMGELAYNSRQEILDLFPELEVGVAEYGSTARKALKSYEGRLLAA